MFSLMSSPLKSICLILLHQSSSSKFSREARSNTNLHLFNTYLCETQKQKTKETKNNRPTRKRCLPSNLLNIYSNFFISAFIFMIKNDHVILLKETIYITREIKLDRPHFLAKIGNCQHPCIRPKACLYCTLERAFPIGEIE